MVCPLAQIDERSLEKIQTLEDSLGVVLIAYEKPPEAASLSPAQLKQIQDLERDMGIRLVAYR